MSAGDGRERRAGARRRDAARAPEVAPKLALVLGGGGSKGALQVGLHRALVELGLRPELIVGASVGAVNGAFIAAGIDPRTLAAGWARLGRDDVFAFNWSLLWRGASAGGVFSPRRLRALLTRHLPARTFEELRVPFAVVATHLGAGEACVWRDGPLVQALLASTAVPGLVPPVRGPDGALHVDGSLADNMPVEVAHRLGATHVVAMNCRTCDACRRETTRLTDVLGQAFSVAADCKMRGMEQAYRDVEDVLLLQPELGEHIRALDFSQGARLAHASYGYVLPRLREWAAGLPAPLRPSAAGRDEKSPLDRAPAPGGAA